MRKWIIFILIIIGILVFNGCAGRNQTAEGNKQAVIENKQSSVEKATGIEASDIESSDIKASGTEESNERANADQLLTGKIIQITGTTIMLAGQLNKTDELITLDAANALVVLSNATSGQLTDLKGGMAVQVSYSGAIKESYPVQVTADSINVTAVEDDLVSLYFKMIQEIYEQEPDLNAGIQILAIDGTGIQNLTETEKMALLYELTNQYGFMTISSDIATLKAKGYIEKGTFTAGIIIKISDTPIKDGQFQFSIQKYKGKDKQLNYADCIATKDGESWNLTIASK